MSEQDDKDARREETIDLLVKAMEQREERLKSIGLPTDRVPDEFDDEALRRLHGTAEALEDLEEERLSRKRFAERYKPRKRVSDLPKADVHDLKDHKPK
ncbi:MAG TPA: hypothetical protein VF329_05095 [Gammaproteobacteria bacterium]